MKSLNDELQNAKNSNDDSNKSLISSLEAEIQRYKSNKDDCTKSHFMDEQRMSSLEAEVQHGIDVIVKLTQFSGSEKSIVDLIEKEIARLTKQQKNCETCQKSHPSADCPQHKKLEELKEKRDEISTNKDNNPRDLLDNLCTGLEKFLGFSKGNYTGEGIVYSDLDRLCDGVMAFLHGVLDNIQPKLGLHRNNIQSAIMSLEANKHLGKEGFNTAIQAVVTGVRQYNDFVQVSNDSVKDPINNLLVQVGEEFRKNVSAILPEKDQDNAGRVEVAKEQVDRKLEQCKENAKTFNEAFNLDTNIAMKNAVNDLNPKLHDSVLVAAKAVKHETSRLEELATREHTDMCATVALVKSTLESARDCVNKTIREDVTKLVNRFRDTVQSFLAQLRHIESKLRQYISKLGEWISKVEELLKSADKNVKTVLNEVKEGSGSSMFPTQIKSIADQIKSDAEHLERVASFAKEEVTAKVKEALIAVNTMNSQLMGDLQTMNTQIKAGVKEYVEKLGEAFKAGMKEAVNYDPFDADGNTGGKGVAAFKKALKSKSVEFKNLLELLNGSSKAPDNPAYGLEWALHSMRGHLSHHLKQSSPLITKIIADLQAPIEERFGPTVGTVVNLKNKPKILQTYQSHVDQNSLTELSNGILKLTAGDGNKLPKAIKKIQQDVTEALTPLEGIENGLALTTFTVKSKLDEMMKAILKAGEAAEWNIFNLKNEYFKDSKQNYKDAANSIKKIKYELETLLGSLSNGPIQDADKFIKSLDLTCESTIQVLENHVKKEVKTAEDTLTTHARKQYVTNIKNLLTKFADKVQSELDPLPAEINYDLTIGQKGFMKKIHDYFASPMNDFFPKRVVSTEQPKTLKDFADKINHCFNHFMLRLQDQDDYKDAHSHFKPPHESLSRLLNKLVDSKHFDHKFSDNLERLRRRLAECGPKQFGETSTVLLEALKKGTVALASQLGNAYVSTYSGVEFADQLWATKKGSEPKSELTDEGRNCAQACLTLLATLHNDFTVLLKERKTYWNKNICLLTKAGEENAFGHLLRECGFRVPSKEGIQDGELNCHEDRDSTFIHDLITKQNLVKQEDEKEDEASKKHHSIIRKLFDHLHSYYEVRHLDRPSSPKAPSNIQQMLTWLTGLPHNHVYQDLLIDGLSSLFEKPKGEAKGSSKDTITVSVEGGISPGVKTAALVKDPDTLDAYPQPITASNLRDKLTAVCQYSHHVLTSVLGHGHADGIYACEFSTNSQGFLYPSSMNTLICTLYDILQRVYEQCYFLYQMCTHDTTLSGCKDCWYGSGVGGSSWKCNSLQCANQICDQTHNQCGNQRADLSADQRCDQCVSCGLKSPLQSFLEDGLQGFLPHILSSSNGKLNCAVKNHFNVPCKTPMGFADITTVASHRQTGQCIFDALHAFCGRKSSPLTALLSQLRCVLPSAPKTLGDMFGFYYSLLNGWNAKSTLSDIRNQHRETAYGDAVRKANFKRDDTTLDITTMFGNTNHRSGKYTPHHDGDLYSLVLCKSKTPAYDTCGPYIKPICRDICGMFAEKHAESFYDLLKQLYETCNSKCGKKETKCYVKSCANGCAKKQSNGKPNDKIHDASCSSIVSCKTMLPTLYSYGFVFDDTDALNGNGKTSTKKTCADLCRTLERICHGKSVLANIVINKIPEFLWKIRAPYIWTLLALWSLSLLYLLHITVVRLDVLRIRSHLRSPSSHRIAAQSLLAAARVRALANVKYFSP
ncbi:hypothetical protein, conserved [Babesia ovata]|uniref:C3H1-type domain-containing protein n=1 Tax=Babesia ovata TaxID=189622 RepID=A0A2H6KKK4_9APIC|nr:uncharacterized protein BOVATA_050120 [Babesia ovata]GBE63519.1 hypothetical protein, conserved [Babesia ovata]